MKIGIVTDSTCDLKESLLKKYKIEVVPLSVQFGNNVYTDGIDLDSNTFFDKLKNVVKLPKTSCPPTGAFLEKYKEMSKKFDSIISIHVSSGLSGTYDTARLAAKQLPDTDIHFVDSSTISLGLGFLVLLAAKLATAGQNLEKILTTIKKAKDNLLLIFTVDELKYMEMGGRIGKASAFLGNIFNINPIISISTKTGQVLPLAKSRGEKRTMAKMVELALEKLKGEKFSWLGFAHGDREKDMNSFKELISNKINNLTDLIDYDILSGRISPTLGCHVGPSVYAAVILVGDFLNFND